MYPYKSMLKQTYPHWEWIIYDDTDDMGNFEFLKKKLNGGD